MQEYAIGRNEAGQSLLKYLSKALKGAPVSFFHKMMRKKNIVLNGGRCDGSEKLAVGDRVKLFLSDETIEKFGGTAGTKPVLQSYPYMPLDIVYEDEDMIFVNKPSGMLTQKADPEDISLNEYIIGYLLHSKALKEADLATFKPSVCNRLDRNTSGLVLAGKSLKGLQKLSEMIKNRTLQKYYIAVAAGRIEKDAAVEGYLAKDGKTNKVFIRPAGEEESLKDGERYIRTDYRVLCAAEDYTVLEIHLITGRPHQIRAHLAFIGHPILGDCKYGDKSVNKKHRLSRQLLHACRIVLPDGREYEAALPKEFEKYADLGFQRP